MLEMREVIYQWQKGKRSRAISRSLGTARNTVRGLLRKAQILALKPESEQEETEKIIEQLRKERYSRGDSGPARKHLSLHHKKIAEWLTSPYMTKTQIVRLFKEEGKKVSEASWRRYIKEHFAEIVRTTSTVHLEIEAGQQAHTISQSIDEEMVSDLNNIDPKDFFTSDFITCFQKEIWCQRNIPYLLAKFFDNFSTKYKNNVILHH